MLLHIVGQQISAVAAFAIYDRISAATGGIPAPAGVLGLGQDRLRACGPTVLNWRDTPPRA
jgi:DNA-3-methyladenine glycosylase II